jgi:hypothetical protein
VTPPRKASADGGECGSVMMAPILVRLGNRLSNVRAHSPDPTIPHTLRDHRQVGALALSSILVLAFTAYLDVFVPPVFAPRVYVRWKPGITDTARAQHERELKLLAGEPYEGTTWVYDLTDPSRQGIGAIVAHGSVEDTGNIDRSRLTVTDDTRAGRTRLHGGLSLLRDTPVLLWLTRLATAFLVLSCVWLGTTGRPALSVLRRTGSLRRRRPGARHMSRDA